MLEKPQSGSPAPSSHPLWRHLPMVLITTMFVIAIILELTEVPPLVWQAKLPLFSLLVFYAWRIRGRRIQGQKA